MNASRLLEHFDRISEAPDAVPKLRKFILDLAVRGKLVEQDVGGEPAAELLNRITSERTKLLGAGGKKRKTAPPIARDEAPFEIPAHWAWSQIADVGIVSPRNIADDGALASFVPMRHIPAEYGATNEHEARSWGEIKSGFTHFAEGDVGLAKITPCFENGKSAVFRNLAGGIGAGTTELHIVRPVLVSADYLLIFLKSPHFIEAGIPRMTGTAGQKRVPTDYFSHAPLPLPPLAEQHRIVAKVDELMGLCDRLEEARSERNSRLERFVDGSAQRIEQLADTPDYLALARAAEFQLAHLKPATTTVDHIDALRKTVLNLAVLGRLTAQDVTEESGSELLTKVDDLLRSRAGSQLRLPARLVPPGGRRLPPGWATTRMGDVCGIVTSGSRGWAEFYSHTGPKLVRAQNIRFGRLRLDDLACVTPPAGSDGQRTRVSLGDILIVITGAGVTTPALMDRDLGEAYVSQHVALLKPAMTSISRWLLLCLMAPCGGRSELIERAYGAGKPGLNLDNIRSLVLPMPPLAEQQRITSRVDELMTLCDQLEAQLRAEQELTGLLLDAAIADSKTPVAN